MSDKGAFGQNVARYAGLRSVAPTLSRKIKTHMFAATRLSSTDESLGRTTPIPNESAYILSVQLRDFRHRRLWFDGRPCPHWSLPKGSINLYDLERTVSAEVRSPFDSVQYYLPRAALLEFARSGGYGAVRNVGLELGRGIDDPVVYHLSLSLLPALARPDAADGLFIDHVAVALYAHLIRFYGEGARIKSVPRGGLTASHERLVKELLDDHLDGDITLSELAEMCQLSTRHFTRAFRQSLGTSPYRWLINRRIDKAKDLLAMTDMPIADIAVACGFANQSHFTTTFARIVGGGPGQWRRAHRD